MFLKLTRKTKISNLLLIPVITLLATGFIGSLVYMSQLEKFELNRVDQEVESVHKIVRNSISDYLNIAESSLGITASFIRNSSGDIDIYSLKQSFFDILNTSSVIDYLYITTTEGNIISVSRTGSYGVSSPSNPFNFELFEQLDATTPIKIKPDLDFRNKDWFKKALESKNLYWSDPYPGEQVDTLAISASLRITDRQDKPMGVVGVDLLLSELEEMMGQSPKYPGSIVCVFKNVFMLGCNGQMNSEMVKLFQSHPEGISNQKIGQSYYYLISNPLNISDLKLVHAIPVVEIKKEFRQFGQDLITIYILSLAIVILVLFLTTSAIKTAISQFLLLIESISSNKFNANVKENTIYEFQTVTDAFNRLIANLSETTASLEVAEQDLKHVNKNINAIVEEKTHELKELSFKDPLTGCFNRRFMDEILDTLTKESDRQTCIAILDLDLFKNINDSYGHDIGDEVLVELVTFFQSRIRKNDAISRYGGEEFIILFSDISLDEAYTVMERFRVEFEQNIFSTKSLKLTFSAGMCSLNNLSVKDVIKRADKALYQAKKAGRNQIKIS